MKLESPKLHGSVGRFATCIRKNADFSWSVYERKSLRPSEIDIFFPAFEAHDDRIFLSLFFNQFCFRQ